MGKPPRERSSRSKNERSPQKSSARTSKNNERPTDDKRAAKKEKLVRKSAAVVAKDPTPPAIPTSLHAAPTSQQRQQLKGSGHALQPTVMVGKDGVSEALLVAVHLALVAHELIKVKLPQIEKSERETMSLAIASGAKGHIVQQLGRVLLLYRRHPEKPRLLLRK